MRSTIVFLLCAVLYQVNTELVSPVDLSHNFDEATQYWIGVTSFSFTNLIAEEKPPDGWYAANEFCAGEHGGTHLDAPYHFARDKWRVGDIPLSHLIAPGIVVDVSAKVEKDFEVRVKDLTAWEDENGPIPQGCVLLINFGWAKFYTNRTAYFGSSGNDTSKLHFPGVSPEAAKWLVQGKKIVGIGLDTPSVDRGQHKDFPTHRALCQENIYILENVAMNAARLPAKGFTLYVLPMKIREGTGAPCRIVAVSQTTINGRSSHSVAMSSVVVATLFILIVIQ